MSAASSDDGLQEPAPDAPGEGRPARPLPPPAFPPGAGRARIRRALDSGPGGLAEEFRSTDGSPPTRTDLPAEAFISPEEPIPSHDEEATAALTEEVIDPNDVVVTGIGDDAHLDPVEMLAGGDPFLIEIIEVVEKLAESLKRRGKAGLHVTPGMTQFEATLRAYCVGYLAGKRAEYEGD